MSDADSTAAGEPGEQPEDGDELNPRYVFVQKVLDQVGSRFEMGAKADPDDPNPEAFDSSELVEWATGQAGEPMPDGSWIQYQKLHEEGTTMEVHEALSTEGALLFWFSEDPIGNADRPRIAHVAVSLGDGRVVEATNGKHDIVRVAEHGDRFTHAGEVPGLVGVELTTDQALDLWREADRVDDDQDRDGVKDDAEAALGMNPGVIDTDRDGVSDGAEAQLGWFDEVSNRRDLDSDGDGLLDVAEERLGTDPHLFDTDGDGLDDHLEIMTGLDPNEFDSSLYARSDEGLDKGAHEDSPGAFGTMALQEHLAYLRLEADPTDPRVDDLFKENFALYGRRPGTDDIDALDAWERNYRQVEADLEGRNPVWDENGHEVLEPLGDDLPLVDEDPSSGKDDGPAAAPSGDGDAAAPATEPPAIVEPAVDSIELGAPERGGTDFEQLDADLEVIETELLTTFDELAAESPPIEPPTIEFPDLDLPDQPLLDQI